MIEKYVSAPKTLKRLRASDKALTSLWRNPQDCLRRARARKLLVNEMRGSLRKRRIFELLSRAGRGKRFGLTCWPSKACPVSLSFPNRRMC
jgi:hypothetical protein